MASLTRFHTLFLLGCAACQTASPHARDADVPMLDAAESATDGGPAKPAPSEEIGKLGGGALASTLDVHVVDESSGEPVPRASISVGTHKVSADAAGNARISGLSGIVQVSVSAADFVPSTWLGVGAAEITIPMRPKKPATRPTARAQVSITGLEQLAARDDGASYSLRLHGSLPLDLTGFDDALLASAPKESVCRFKAGERAACTLSVVTRLGAQRLYAILEAVNAAGESIEPVAISVSPPVNLAPGSTSLATSLPLLPAADLIKAIVKPLGPPTSGASAKVVGVPGMKLNEGSVMLFPAKDHVLLPRTGGALGDGTYWYISEASYVDADGDALRILVSHRGLEGGELAPDPWPEVSARPVLAATRLTLASSTAELRRVVVRDRGGLPILDAVIIGKATTLELPAAPAQVDVQEIHADFDPIEFSLADALAASLWDVERSAKF
jgi:hypothetical protein